MFDITLILKGIIILAVALVVYKLWPMFKAAAPAALVEVVKLIARFAVYAIEAEYGSGNGKAKFDEALKMAQSYLQRFHLTFDTETIKSAINEEWLKLNMEQLSTGMKKTE